MQLPYGLAIASCIVPIGFGGTKMHTYRKPSYSFHTTKPRGDIQETIKFFDDIFKTDTFFVSVKGLLSALKGMK